MHRPLVDFIQAVKSDRDRLIGYDEAKTKQYIIQRVLHLLGWDIFEEVIPEYQVTEGLVDYAISSNGTNFVFVEAKRVKESLEDHQRQLLNYAFSDGVELAFLTNGVAWWLYLPLAKGGWEERRFFAVDLIEQDSAFASDNLMRFLSRDQVVSGEAVKRADEYRKSRQRKSILEKTFPVAWNKILKEPDEMLLDLLIETTESLSGYRADQEMAAVFLSRNLPTLVLPESKIASVVEETEITRTHQKRTASDYAGTKPRGFSLAGEYYEVSHWIDILYKVCELLHAQDATKFRDLSLSLRGRKRPYFSIDPEELRGPSEFSNTGIFVETNLSAEGIYRRCRSLIASFDYDPDDLQIYLE